MENFGWPCYEGNRSPLVATTGSTSIYVKIYNDGTITSDLTQPYFPISHGTSLNPTECPGGGASTSGLAFYESGGHYPGAYDDALFFADYSWKCVWVMFAGGSGLPDTIEY